MFTDALCELEIRAIAERMIATAIEWIGVNTITPGGFAVI